MVTRALPGNLADTMVEGLADAAGGAVLRLAWDRADNMGMVATGLFILGGLVLPMFGGRGALMNTVSSGMFHSGSAIAGWLTTEKVLKLDAPAAQRALNPGVRRPALGSAYRPSYDGAKAPEVALHGVNPNTGETILLSRN